MKDPLRDAIITNLRMRSKARVGTSMETITNQLEYLTAEQKALLAARLAMVAVDALADVLELTPQQFNAVRRK